MKKKLLLFWLSFAFISNLFAQQDVFRVQGVPRADVVIAEQGNRTKMLSTEDDQSFTFDDIEFWVGEGQNEAMLVVDWYDDKGSTLVWGYRWDGNSTGATMIMAIAAADPRFTCMTGMGTIGGLGYDSNNNGSTCVVSTASTLCPANGNITVMNYRYDGWSAEDPTNRWQSGWMNGYWSYQVKDDINDDYKYSSVGAGSRILKNGSVDGWAFQSNMGGSQTGVFPRAPYVAAPAPPVSLGNIKYWIGEGENETAIVIKWNDGKEADALVWGYRWDGEVTLIEALKDIAYDDERLFLVVDENDSIAGVAFDLNGKNIPTVIYNKDTVYPLYPVNGLLVIPASTKFDNYENADSEDHWQAGQSGKGVWTYLIRKNGDEFALSAENYREKLLENASWNALNFNLNFDNPAIGDDLVSVSPYIREEIDYTKGIFFINEDWFGHTNGSLNFLTENGEWVYRAYSRENRGQAFGCTTSFGTIYGDNFYFVSKQAAESGDKQYEPGGRLVVADAKTLKKKAGFDDIGGGDGRAFLGVDENTGYISTSSGIVLFDIPTLTVGEKVTGTEGGSVYAGQVGTMLRIEDYVFACKQNSGVLVIDAKKHKVVQLIACENIGTLVRSKDGYLWATAYSDGLWKIDPYTFEVVEKRELETRAWIPGSWGAWTSSLICASDDTNTLYWAKMNGGDGGTTYFGTEVFKYDIDNPDLSEPFYVIGEHEGFYGSGINIDPVTGNLILTTTQKGQGGNYQYNWVHFVNSVTGEVIEIKALDAYYWFPGMSAFPDNYEPVISGELTSLAISGRIDVSLPDKVTDPDSRNGAIIKQVEVIEGAEYVRASVAREHLVLQPLSKNPFKLRLTVNSNGKVVTREMEVDVTEFITVESVTVDKSEVELSPRDTYQLTATVYPETASNKTVIWSSGDEAIATVDENGLVTPLQSGKEVTITATTENEGKTADCTFRIGTIPVEGMSLDPQFATLDARVKEELQLMPKFIPEDASNQRIRSWRSENPEVATVDGTGKVTALSEGTTIITAVSEEGNIEATCKVTTYISIQYVSLNLPRVLNIGESYQATITVTPENATNKNIKEWKSAAPELVSVDQDGFVTALAANGTGTRITVFMEDRDLEAVGSVFVNIPVEEVEIIMETNFLAVGEEMTIDVLFTPEEPSSKEVDWQSSNPEIATVDNDWGWFWTNTTVKALSEGDVTITVTTYPDDKTATALIRCVIPVEEVSIEAVSEELFIGETLQLSATILPENATVKNVSWESSDTEIASVDENGLVTAWTAGEVILTVTTEEGGKTATQVITCKPVPVESVTITPDAAELLLEETIQLTAVVLPENATNKKISWESSDTEIAAVDENGLVTALSIGEVTITVATEDEGKIATAVITCKPIPVASVSLTPDFDELEIGDELQLQVTILPENATNQHIQAWISSNEEVASVADGLVVALKEGETTITVVTEDQQLEAYCEIVVLPGNSIEGEFVIATLVYPTVTTGKIIVEQREMDTIKIVNTIGDILQVIVPQQQREIIDISGYLNGIYFIEVGGKAFKIVKK